MIKSNVEVLITDVQEIISTAEALITTVETIINHIKQSILIQKRLHHKNGGVCY